MPGTTLSLKFDGSVCELTLAGRPAEHLLEPGVGRELEAMCEEISSKDGCRAVLLSAEGDVFSRGWDWQALAAASEGGPLLEAARRCGLMEDPFGCLQDLPRPVVCAINGDATGAGLELALACDIRIAAEGARLGLPEVQMGMLPLAGGIQRLARLAGRGKAMEMVLTGEPIDTDEALACGLVSAVVPANRLYEEALALCSRIAERGALAIAYAKEAVTRGIEMPLEQALRYETDLTIILQTTEDRAEGVRAFLEKRKPEFKGN